MFKQYRSKKVTESRWEGLWGLEDLIREEVKESLDESFQRLGNYWVIEDIEGLQMLEENLKVYKKEQLSENPETVGYNYIFTSNDKDWVIHINDCEMNNIHFDTEDSSFIESKARAIIKHKGETVEHCKIHLKRTQNYTKMNATKDPYEKIRDYLNLTGTKETQIEVARSVLDFFSDGDEKIEIQDSSEGEIFVLKTLKKYARNLWPKLKNGRYFMRFTPSEDHESILNRSYLRIESNNQMLILVTAMLMFLEELLNPSKISKRDKQGSTNREIMEVDKYWDFTLSRPVEMCKVLNHENLEIMSMIGKFSDIFNVKRMTPQRIQNIFLMMCFKSMQMYYGNDCKIKSVLVFPQEDETVAELVEIIDPSQLMVKTSKCYIYDMK